MPVVCHNRITSALQPDGLGLSQTLQRKSACHARGAVYSPGDDHDKAKHGLLTTHLEPLHHAPADVARNDEPTGEAMVWGQQPARGTRQLNQDLIDLEPQGRGFARMAPAPHTQS